MTIRALRLLAPVCLLGLAGTALAASVHFKGGRNAGPRLSDEGVTLSASGCIAGLGNGDVEVLLTGSGEPEVVCQAPGNENEAPGQNPAEVDVSGGVSIPEEEIKNGSVCFFVETEPPDDPSGTEAGCPNDRWDAEIRDIDFTDATIQVFQNGQLVLSFSADL